MPFQILLKLLAQKLNCTFSGIFEPAKGTCTKYAASNSSTSGIIATVIGTRFAVTILRRAYCIYFGVSWRGFSVITSPNRTYLTFLDEAWHISEGPRCALTQEKWGKLPHGFGLKVPKHVLFFFVTNATQPFGHFPAPVSTIFETEDLNRFLHAYTSEISSNFCAGGFSRPKNSQKYSTLGLDVGDRAAAQAAKFPAVGIILGASPHPKDVPYVREFLWGTYGLSAVSLRKTPAFGD